MENTREIKIGQLVMYPKIDQAPFTVKGIRENQLEIQGDFSGGTHNVSQTGWVDINDLELPTGN